MNGPLHYLDKIKGSRPGTVVVPDGIGVIRYWDTVYPTAQHRLADDVIDAILRDVFQGKKDHLRDHARAVAYKAIRGHDWPYFQEMVEKAVADRLASLSPTSCEAGFPAQSCQGCDAGDCAMTPDAEAIVRNATKPTEYEETP